MLRKFFRLATLRPYGGSLCAPSTSAWASFAVIGVTLMACAEAGGWSYVGFFLGTEWHRYLAAAAMGLVAFLAVWIVDSTFLTLDLRREEYEHRLASLSGTPRQTSGGAWQKLKAMVSTAGGGVIVRLAMVAGSLFVVAPYVSQLFFYRDVSMVLARQDLANVQAARNRIALTHDQKIQVLDAEQNELRNSLIQEAAGHGPSKRFGRGPTVKTMEDRLSEIQRQLQAERVAKDAELVAYDKLSPGERATKYGVSVGREGIQARNEAVSTIAKQSGYARTEWTIRAFLLGLFLMVLVLKWYQPQTARVYYSEFCQDSYARYRRGQFDHRLPDAEKALNNGDMTPLRFDEWLRSDYADYERDTRNATVLGSINARLKLEEDSFKAVQASAEADLAPCFSDLDDAITEVAPLEEEFATVESELVRINQELSEHQDAINAIDQAMAYPRAVGGGAGGFVRRALDNREAWCTGLVDLEKKRRTAELRREWVKVRVETQRTEIERIQAEIASRSTVLTNVEEHITDSRTRALNDIKTRSV
jgi:hypothetical protein